MDELEQELSGILEGYSGEERKNVEEKVTKLKALIEERKSIYKELIDKITDVGEKIELDLVSDQGGALFTFNEFSKKTEEIEDLRKELGVKSQIPLKIDRKTPNYLQGNAEYTDEHQNKTPDVAEEIKPKMSYEDITKKVKELIKNEKDEKTKENLSKIQKNIEELKNKIEIRKNLYREVTQAVQISNLNDALSKDYTEYIRDQIDKISAMYVINTQLKRMSEKMGIEYTIPLYGDIDDLFPEDYIESQLQKLSPQIDKKEEKQNPQEQKPKMQEPQAQEQKNQEPKNVEKPKAQPSEKMYINIEATRANAKDFYHSKNLFQYNFTANDRLFFANSTIGQIKKQYGDLLPRFNSQAEEKYFFSYIKFMAREDGYYLDPSVRYLVKKIDSNVLLKSEQYKDNYYKRFFGDCKNNDEINERFGILFGYAGLPQDYWKMIDDYYEDLDKRTIKKKVPVQEPEPKKENKAEEIDDSKQEPNQDQNNDEKAKKITEAVQQKIINGDLEPLKIIVKGNKMTINGEEYDYVPFLSLTQNEQKKLNKNQQEKIRDVEQRDENDPIYKALYTDEVFGELEEMKKTLTDEGQYIYTDTNIINGLIKYCAKDVDLNNEQSILMGREKLKKVMFSYMKLSNGDFEVGDETLNLLDIGYDLTGKNGLSRKEFKYLKEMAYESEYYAKVRLKPIARLLWVIRNLNDRINSPVLESKEKPKALGDGSTQKVAGNSKQKDAKNAQVMGANLRGVEQVPLTDEELFEIAEKWKKEAEEESKDEKDSQDKNLGD